MTDFETDIERARRRPGMFIGDVHDGSGLTHMIWELVANSLDEHVRGTCRTITVDILEDGAVTVEDDGRGIPVHDLDGVPFAQRALTSLHRTPTFDGHAPHEHVGPHGVGLMPVNALSEWFLLESFRDGRHHRQRYVRGEPTGPLEVVGPSSRTGTRMTFLPDPTIFSDTWFNPGTVATRLRELACLLPSLTFTFADHRRHRFNEPEGLRVFLKRIRRAAARTFGALTLEEVVEDISIEAALEWHDHRWSAIDSYANIQQTTDGGTHVQGLVTGLALGLRDVLQSLSRNAERAPVRKPRLERLRNAVRRGLHAVVCVRLMDPTFESPTKSRLATPEVAAAVSKVVRRAMGEELRRNEALREHLVELVEDGRRAERAAL